ncbi:MAG: hypothetical protein RIG62_17480 [Cyclobacteriaceae bacterium]
MSKVTMKLAIFAFQNYKIKSQTIPSALLSDTSRIVSDRRQDILTAKIFAACLGRFRSLWSEYHPAYST